MLWLCLYFPNLPLEIFTRSSWEAAPLAVSIDQSHRQQVLIGNAAARSRGVHSGMSISAAYAVAGDLRVLPHNEAAEAAALEHLASWSTQFTSLVNLYPPQGLLLEIAGSLRFFGGLPLLLRHIRQGLKELGYEVRHAIAPTPLGAVLLARSGQSVEITDLAVMRTRLAAISLTLMDFPPKVLTSLRGLGTRTLGDCLCLPRDGLSRRFGPELLTYFDQMLGNIPDLRKPFIPPPCFESRLILPSEVDNTEALLFALRRLLLELTGFLIARDAGVQQLEIILAHRKSAVTRLQLDLITPSRDLNHLLLLLRERFDHTSLQEPVEEIGLNAKEILSLLPQNQPLFSALEPKETNQDWALLIDRLRARLGEEAVSGLCMTSEHRPEWAWRICQPGEPGPQPDFAYRPLWLLSEPLLLETKNRHPCWQGRLILKQGPERIESGWWDGYTVMRDYFIAENAQGSKLWIFRERSEPKNWFLHGLFS